MKNGSAFEGLGVAMVTPFTETGAVDYPSLTRLVEHLVTGGVDYLVVHGTTGESPVLDKAEKRSVLDFILEVNNGRKPVVLGVGGNNTRVIAEELAQLDTKGLLGILSVSPAYNRPGDEGLFQHYSEVSKNTDLPIILYNVPSRTAGNVRAEVTLRCAEELSNIVAVKEASGDLNQISHIIKDAPEGFAVLSGDDLLALPIIALGGRGVISVIGNALPETFGRMIHATMDGDMEKARKHQYELLSVMDLIFKEGNPAGIKELLQHMGICKNHLRLPLTNVSKSLSQEIYQAVSEIASVKDGAKEAL
jgi:4-hydroxy-tetrahydrodipicolinate synthase